MDCLVNAPEYIWWLLAAVLGVYICYLLAMAWFMIKKMLDW